MSVRTCAGSHQGVERWLDAATNRPNEASRKARLKMMLVKGS